MNTSEFLADHVIIARIGDPLPLLDCGHPRDTGHTYAGKPAWEFVLDWDGKRKICHACADARILDCGHPPSSHHVFTTGYGTNAEGRRLCYLCCAEEERARMIRTGSAVLYLSTTDYVTDWPGYLKFPTIRTRYSRNGGGFGAGRHDVYFYGPDGRLWHGVNRGDNHIVRCKRLKRAKP